MREGPLVTINFTCYECKFVKSEHYEVQGDRGFDIYCTYDGNKYVGDSCWATPNFCPFKDGALKKKIEE